VIELVEKKCLPILWSLDFAISSVVAKIFVTRSSDKIKYCREAFGLASLEELFAVQRRIFLARPARIEHTLGIVRTFV
jgi:hypothetical protein